MSTTEPVARTQFSLLVYAVQGSSHAGDQFAPAVDGTPLFEVIGHDWPGVPTYWFDSNPGEWLGSPRHVEYGRSVVLDGSCGVAGCCGVVARISVGPEVVIWDQFYCHGGLDLTDAFRFEFAADQYRSQLAAWDAIPRVEWKAFEPD